MIEVNDLIQIVKMFKNARESGSSVSAMMEFKKNNHHLSTSDIYAFFSKMDDVFRMLKAESNIPKPSSEWNNI